ncbi:TorF family putative porin [Sphingomonas glaciei]|uniref:TorF family putative porin n=1 Tax=Sphingomonas glaciei TaxID=2938948 RepID=A0ABY5MX40_9SPHN|nr:TorF family putative porin [Sphingomonas glaciei]UUR08340.1 TorF family putative porin [Sphingomonas glaciei]
MRQLAMMMTVAGLLTLPSAAAAQDAAAKAPPTVVVSGGATLVSDYRYRGVSQTDRRPALQGSLGVSLDNGLYASIWGSSIDDYVANGSDQEIDFAVGFKRSVGATTFDVGVLYYYYPSSGGINTDFVEPYVAVSQTFGPVTAKALAAYAPKQNALTVGNGKEDNLYLAGDLSAAVPNSPISVTAHVGRSFGPSYITLGKAHTDWSLGASATIKGLTAGIAYVDTDAYFITPSGRNASKAGIVASLGVAF